MRDVPAAPLRLAVTLAALWLAACGGGGDMPAAGPAPLADPATVTAVLRASVAPGLAWSQAGIGPRIWHSLATDASGQVLVGGEAPDGHLDVSTDGGATWRTPNLPTGIWIASAVAADASRIVALQYGGGMYTSADRGASWSRVTSSPLVDAPGGLLWEAVTVSRDGRRIAAVIQQGGIVLSADGGATWRAAHLPDEPQQRWWRWIDGSADGSTLVAVSHNGEVYRSQDAGTTWRAVAVNAAGTVFAESWYRVKVSADGATIALAANSFGGAPGSGVFVSRDGGATWARGYVLTADYTGIAMSADGQAIGVTVSNGAATGRVLFSSDGGASFVALQMPGSDTNWRAIAMSAAGDRFAVAAGAFNTGAAGLVWTGVGTATTPAPAPSPSPSPAPAPSPSPAPAPSCSAPAWDTTTRYMPGDRVMRNGVMYAATAQSASVWNVNSPPEWTPTYWAVTACSAPAPAPAPAPSPSPAPSPAPAPAPAPSPAPASSPAPAPSPSPAPAPAPSCAAPAWNGTTRYLPGDRVLRNGTLYVATPLSSSVWNVNSPPEWTPSYWSKASCS